MGEEGRTIIFVGLDILNRKRVRSFQCQSNCTLTFVVVFFLISRYFLISEKDTNFCSID